MIQAVELCVRLGKHLAAAIRQLGYTTKNTFLGWYWEHEQRLDLPRGYAGRKPKHSQAQEGFGGPALR